MNNELVDGINNILPIGSVVKVNNFDVKLMITTILLNEDYDYRGVPWPFGDISRDIKYVFNHEDIEKVYFKGYENDLTKNIKNGLIGLVEEK